MANIEITRTHKLAQPEAKKRAETIAKDMVGKLAGMRWEWSGDTIRFDAPSGTAKGVTGTLALTPGSIRVAVDLPFMLKIFKGKIESEINEALTKAINGAN